MASKVDRLHAELAYEEIAEAYREAKAAYAKKPTKATEAKYRDTKARLSEARHAYRVLRDEAKAGA